MVGRIAGALNCIESKASFEALQRTLVTFLEYISSPFGGSGFAVSSRIDTNQQPAINADALKAWWDQIVRRVKCA